MEDGEKQAIQKCQQGDVEEFGVLYDKYIKKIYNFVYYKTLHKETAEDITSLVFTKALEKIGTFRVKDGYFSAWLHQIARHTVIDHYRTQKKEKDIEDVWDLSSNEDIERDADARAQLEKVEKYLKKLSSEQRDIIIMRLWQDMPHAQIAQALGKSESAVKVAYSRAMKDLRKNADILILLFVFLSSVCR